MVDFVNVVQAVAAFLKGGHHLDRQVISPIGRTAARVVRLANSLVYFNISAYDRRLCFIDHQLRRK